VLPVEPYLYEFIFATAQDGAVSHG
jgi:hypothetical protein